MLLDANVKAPHAVWKDGAECGGKLLAACEKVITVQDAVREALKEGLSLEWDLCLVCDVALTYLSAAIELGKNGTARASVFQEKIGMVQVVAEVARDFAKFEAAGELRNAEKFVTRIAHTMSVWQIDKTQLSQLKTATRFTPDVNADKTNAAAEQAKEKAKAFFAAKHFADAWMAFNEVVRLPNLSPDSICIAYSNIVLSGAELQRSAKDQAGDDEAGKLSYSLAQAALNGLLIRPAWWKMHSRAATAFEMRKHYKRALQYIQRALLLAPQDAKDALEQQRILLERKATAGQL